MSGLGAELSAALTELGRVLGRPPRVRDIGTQSRVVTVTADGGDGTVTVDLAGSALPAVPHLASYTPTAGDRVWLMQDSGAPVVIGKKAAT